MGGSTMRTDKIHKYKGYEIKSGLWLNRKFTRWYIQTQHFPTGIDWSPENCPQVYSLKQACEKINEMLAMEAAQ
jgi:hypothetical protein